MPLIKSVFSLRKSSHVETRLELRDERLYFRIVLRMMLLPFFISFAAVDALATGQDLADFAILRTLAAGTATALFLLLRSRTHYGVRHFIVTGPWVFTVEYIMIKYDLTHSPYFAGFGLVLFGSSMFFPTKLRRSLPHYLACIAPICVWYAYFPMAFADNLIMYLMAIGTALICAFNASQLHEDLRRKFMAQETISRDLGKRQLEVWKKANELLKRKAFESQFSPQVVSAVLAQGSRVLEMSQRKIVALVIDVEGSTAKAKALDPISYKTVIEEVFDVFSSACLRWNVTVDKFTGDGAQAFAGAPVEGEDDLQRALFAAKDTLQMLRVRNFSLGKRWDGPLRVRIAACEGTALVGFLGRGSLKSFTAIGDTVSFAHRLCANGEPGWIACYSLSQGKSPELSADDWNIRQRDVGGLKGFGDRVFSISLASPNTSSSILVDNGRCPKCETPLILEESPSGSAALYCPGCAARENLAV
jgi:adenylate cyclase